MKGVTMMTTLFVLSVCLFIGVSQATDSSNVIYVETDDCKFAIDVIHLQDLSSSYSDDVQNLVEQVEDLYSSILTMFPGSNLGLNTFIDKPAHQCYPTCKDFCWDNVAPLGTPMETIRSKLNELVDMSKGGGDYQENAVGAMMRAMMSPNVGWRQGDVDPVTGLPVRRIMIVSTDGVPHTGDVYDRARQLSFKDDAYAETDCPQPYPDYKPFAEVVTPEALATDDNAGCVTSDFPSWTEWANALKQYHIIPVFLVGNWTYEYNNRLYFPKMYHDYFIEDPVLKLCCDNIDGLLPFYQVQMSRMGIQGLAASIRSDGSDVKDVVLSLLTDLPKLICRPPTTTTTTTTTSTTTTSTTSTSTKTTTKAATTTTAAAGGGGGSGAVIGGAAAGAAAAAAAGLVYAKKVGLTMPFQRTPEVDTSVIQDVDAPDSPGERETFEAVTADMFT